MSTIPPSSTMALYATQPKYPGNRPQSAGLDKLSSGFRISDEPPPQADQFVSEQLRARLREGIEC